MRLGGRGAERVRLTPPGGGSSPSERGASERGVWDSSVKGVEVERSGLVGGLDEKEVRGEGCVGAL